LDEKINGRIVILKYRPVKGNHLLAFLFLIKSSKFPKSNTMELYAIIIAVLLILWLVLRQQGKKQRNRMKDRNDR
jgi:hypothetical protein